MSMTSALTDLGTALQTLTEAVDELVVTVHEDRPTGSDVAVVDHLVETVSEVQGAVARARTATREAAPVELARLLPDVDESVDEAVVRYWCDLRAHRPSGHLRRTASERGREWQAWQASVERAQDRCSEPLAAARLAVRRGWQEIGELVSLRLLPDPGPPAAPESADSPFTTTTRRSS